ncbi:uncharacterized protein B0H18DRAFT_988994 [Fomitopsis serialis]|uniref:uncharacterized protein n=1 Tax=Fomitopsis serialis TaxID=139415 RepID=UPI002008D9BB|nr:uncharacterized protein B0H18DRAFT_988994 [Neoantrodia serialis]KAH9931978.1 hypothetical protein B0H18DRAFT_988994 [Neoantrodia serialis]
MSVSEARGMPTSVRSMLLLYRRRERIVRPDKFGDRPARMWAGAWMIVDPMVDIRHGRAKPARNN